MFTNASVAAGRDARYSAHLRRFNRINADLKRDGILAPSNSSIEATDKLYGAIGRPLDSIPTIHVGGTNGKVRVLAAGNMCFAIKICMHSQV